MKGLITKKELNKSTEYQKYWFLNSTVHILKVKREHVNLKLILNKDKLSNTVKTENALFGINAAFYDIKTKLPFMGFKSAELETDHLIPNIPAIVINDAKAEIVKDISQDEKEFFQVGPVLIWNSQKITDYSYFKENQHLFDRYIDELPAPRSVFAYDKDYYYFITVDGRSKESKGLFLGELTDFLMRLNLINAINLDGGSSTTLVYKNKILNVPSGIPWKMMPKLERSVSSVLLGFEKK